MAAGLNCVLATAHGVSSPKKNFEGGEGKQGDPGVPISGPRLARWYQSLVAFFFFLGLLLRS